MNLILRKNLATLFQPSQLLVNGDWRQRRKRRRGFQWVPWHDGHGERQGRCTRDGL